MGYKNDGNERALRALELPENLPPIAVWADPHVCTNLFPVNTFAVDGDRGPWLICHDHHHAAITSRIVATPRMAVPATSAHAAYVPLAIALVSRSTNLR